MSLKILFLLFMIYAFLGWVLETIVVSIESKKIVHRGFLVGPYIPIFGVGAILITLLLSDYDKDIFVLFIMSCFLGAILEYITSYLMEKIFNTRWWDYSHEKFNLNGRVCLRTTVAFGILGIILIKILNPFFINLLDNISDFSVSIIVIILAIIFVTDLIVSFRVISKIKSVNFGLGKDTTEEVSLKVREALKKRSLLTRRLVSAFPDLKILGKFKK